MSDQGNLRAIDNDALIEPAFRRLLSALEGERERLRGTWQQIQQEREATSGELDRLKVDTEDWCASEKEKIEAEWKRLSELTDKMNDLWPGETEPIEINCSGTIFCISKTALCSIEGSVLARVFSDQYIEEVPRDELGRFFLDFNPICFGIVIEYLQNRRLRMDAPVPVVPNSQKHNMELLAEAWKLTPFLNENRINPVNTTSLLIKKNMIQATHPGWQLITAQHPLPVAGPSYFEVTVVRNPDPRGGLAIGLCGHIPTGNERFSIRLHGSIMYNSNNGLIGDCYEDSDVPDKIQLVEGATLGIKHDVANHLVLWYHNRNYVGQAHIKKDWLHPMRTLYPVFALYVTGLTLKIDFSAEAPSLTPDDDEDEEEEEHDPEGLPDEPEEPDEEEP